MNGCATRCPRCEEVVEMKCPPSRSTVDGLVGLLTPEDSARVWDDLLTAINTMTYEFQQMCQNVSGIVHHTMASK